MSEIMSLSQFSVDLKEAAMLDYYTACFWWSKEQQFSQEQMSAFFTVTHTLIENMKGKGNLMTTWTELLNFYKYFISTQLASNINWS